VNDIISNILRYHNFEKKGIIFLLTSVGMWSIIHIVLPSIQKMQYNILSTAEHLIVGIVCVFNTVQCSVLDSILYNVL